MPGLSFLRVVDNDELARRDAAFTAALVEQQQQEPLLLGLSAHLRECWDAAVRAKQPIEDQMLRSLRQRRGEYEASTLAAIRQQGGSEIYMLVTEVKCRAAESWLRDTLLGTGEPPWAILPTPVPSLSAAQQAELEAIFEERVIALLGGETAPQTREDMAQLREMVAQDYRMELLDLAKRRTDGMAQKIADQFAHGGWAEAFNGFVTDLTTFPCAFIKGPVVRRQRKLEWVVGPDGRTKAVSSECLAPEFERVDPFDVYPEPGITTIDEGYLFQRHPLSRSALADLIGVPGYSEDAIRVLLDEGPRHSWLRSGPTTDKYLLENKHSVDSRPTDVFDALEFWGKVSGQMLLDWGLTHDEIPDAAREYDANVWLVGNYVIKAVLNYDPLGQKPYCKSSFIKMPGAFWGRAIPETIADIARVCNACARAMMNNMGIASGPQVEVNLDRLPADHTITQLTPWRIWQTLNDPMGSSAPAVRFNQPDDRAAVLLGVFDRFLRLADDHSGIPAYIYGNLDVQGAGRTASGLSMLMGSAGKGIRQVISHIDNDVIQPIVQRQFLYNMRYDPDESIKGDATIVARGANHLSVKEILNTRRIEFLNSTANPIDIEIIGREGRATILREVARGLQMPVEEIIPSPERQHTMSRVVAAQQAQSPPDVASTFADGSPAGGNSANLVSGERR